MKFSGKAYLLGALLIAGCATGPTGKQAQTSASNRVLEAYNVPELLTQAAPAVSQSLDNNLPDSVSDADRKRLHDIVYDAYSPESLQADVAKRLRERADQAGRKKALAAAAESLNSPLATRMIGLEGAAGDKNFARDFRAFVDQPASDARKQRLTVIDGLAGNMRIIELQTDFNVTLLDTMVRARNVAIDAPQRVDEDQITRMLSNTRQGIHGKLEKQVPAMLLYVYRDVDDTTLQQYANLQAQPDMVWTNQALEQAIAAALATAGDKIPERFNSTP